MLTKDITVETDLHPTLTSFLFTLDTLYRKWNSELIITSGSEDTAVHSFTSLHYAKPCQAVDIRTWQINDVPIASAQRLDILKVRDTYCKKYNIAPNWFDVVLESNHIHIEYQPKRKDFS